MLKKRSLKSTRRPKFRKMFLTACYNVKKPRKEMASDSSVAALQFQWKCCRCYSSSPVLLKALTSVRGKGEEGGSPEASAGT